MVGPSVSSIFRRIDINPADGGITKEEMKKMVETARVGTGAMGSMKVSEATKALMKEFDANQDGKVTESELRPALYHYFKAMVQGDGPEPAPGEMTQKALYWFDQVDTNHNGKVSYTELQTRLKAELERRHEDYADIKAEVGAKLAIYLINEDGDADAGRTEMESLAMDIEAHPEWEQSDWQGTDWDWPSMEE